MIFQISYNYLDLCTFSDNLFIFSQSFILVSSLFIAVFKSWSCSLLDSLFRLLDRVVSSAYIIKSNRLLACEKSFMYKMNSSGPRMEPCGTPVVIDRLFDLTLLISVHCFLSVR